MTLCERLDARFYPGIPRGWDLVAYRNLVLSRIRPEHHVLDLGAGRGIYATMSFRGRATRICGVDPEATVLTNPHLDEGRIGRGEAIPYPDASFDVVISCDVLEHLEAPAQVLAEVARVLKRGGRFLFKTPNRRHYVPLIARIVPQRFHARFARAKEADVFPTLYRVNTTEAIARVGRQAGLALGELQFLESRPNYLRPWGAAAYLWGIGYERLVNATPALASFRSVIVGELVRT